MAFLREQDRELLTERFEKELTESVKVRVFSEPVSGLIVPGRRQCETCRETEELMTEVAELSSNIDLQIHNVREEPEIASEYGIALTPTISISSNGDAGIRFIGIPAGYEFSSFLETLISAATPGAGLQPESADKVASIADPLEIKTFVTPT